MQLQTWRGGAVRSAIGRDLGPGAIVVGRPGSPSPSWLAGLPFGPDQFFVGPVVAALAVADLSDLLRAMLSSLPESVHRIYHYDLTWADPVAQTYAAAGFRDFVHRYGMVRALPGPASRASRLRLEALGESNQEEFFATYGECLVDCHSPMSLEDARDPSAALRFQMSHGHAPRARQWLLGRTSGNEVAGMVLLDRYGPAPSDWVVTFLGTAAGARGHGYGKELLLRGAERAAASGARTLHLAVCQPNTPAVSLYRKVGFRTRESYRVFRLER